MIVLKLFSIIALTHFVKGVEDWNECVKQATAKGIPSIDLPPHDPLVLVRNYTLNFTVAGNDVETSLTDLIWWNIPWWNVTTYNKTYEDDKYAIYAYDLYWTYFNLTGNYDAHAKNIESGVGLDIKGDFQIVLHHVDWFGYFNTTKATNKSVENINELKVEWTNKEIEVLVTDNGVLMEGLDALLKGLVEPVIKAASDLNLVGTAFQSQINSKWYGDPERLDGLKDWCAQNVNSTQTKKY